MPLRRWKDGHVRQASNDNLDDVLGEIRRKAGVVRDELFERVVEPARIDRATRHGPGEAENDRARRSAVAARPTRDPATS